MTHVFYNEQEWLKYATYYLVPTARSLQSLLLEWCPEELFVRLKARIQAMDVWLRSSYVEVVLHTERGSFYLRNVGYSSRPAWILSGHAPDRKWFTIRVSNQDLLRCLEQLADGSVFSFEQFERVE